MKIVNEKEVCVCFEPNTPLNKLIEFVESVLRAEGIHNKIDIDNSREMQIKDTYLNERTRIRQTISNFKMNNYLETKEGSKDNVRLEKSTSIDLNVYHILQTSTGAKFKVNKNRTFLSLKVDTVDEAEELSKLNLTISIDKFTHPFSLIMIEFETEDTELYRSLRNKLTGKYRLNTKSAWEYFNRKITFVGAPASGKTTMTRNVVNKLSVDYGASVEQITEYARTHIARYGAPPWYFQPMIDYGQARRESDASAANILVTDGPRFLGYIYGVHYYNEKPTPQSIYLHSKLYKQALTTALDYSDIILLEPKPVKEDGIRYQTAEDIKKLYNSMKEFLEVHNIPYRMCDYTKCPSELIKEIFDINTLPYLI